MRRKAHFQTSFKTGSGGGCEHGGAGEDRAFETIGDAAGNVPDGKRHRDRDHTVDRIMPAEMDRADPAQRRIPCDHPADREPHTASGVSDKRGEAMATRAQLQNLPIDPAITYDQLPEQAVIVAY